MSILGFLGGAVGGLAGGFQAQTSAAERFAQRKLMFPPYSSLLGAIRRRTGWNEVPLGKVSKVKKNGLAKFPQEDFSWEDNFKEAYR